MKMVFDSYKNAKMYKVCKTRFNKKVRCDYCKKELNRSYLNSHIKKQRNYQPRMQWHIQQQRYNGNRIGSGVYNAPSNAACVGVSGGASGDHSGVACGVACGAACNSENIGDSENNSKLIVGPLFCGKTHLMLNTLRLIRLEDPERQIRIIRGVQDNTNSLKLVEYCKT